MDETCVWVNVHKGDKPRYQTKKNEIATNVLGVCFQGIQFIYILWSWEGSTSDSRVLWETFSRGNRLTIPHVTMGFLETIDFFF